jgi:hypothetical protein
MQFIMTDSFKPAAAHKAAHAFCALVLLLVAAPRSWAVPSAAQDAAPAPAPAPIPA